MGLSLHVHAHAPATLSGDEVRSLVARWHAVAETFAAEGRVDRTLGLSDNPDDLDRFATAWISRPHPDDPDTVTGTAVPPIEGWIFLVQLGKGCEPLVLGLCRYPGTVKAVGDWRLVSSCKTQYASLHGWEQFRRCHVAAVNLALAGQTLGVDIRVEDEGGYWPGRDETVLRAAVERLNRVVAGLAGALKDAEDPATGEALSVQAPILEHPGFERLEAEAYDSADAEKIAAVLKAIRKESR